MKRRKLQWNVIPDDGGQALTEFVIVIPIVLLFFFAMVQYFSIIQASQLGDYAAFCAARTYAVAGAVDTNAQSEAQSAASIALAPIARPVPGEIGGNTSIGQDVSGLVSEMSSIAGSSTLAADALNYCEGYFMANYVRFNSKLLGGSVTVAQQGTPAQVDVTINYPQPIYIPGLAGLWNFVGHGNIYSDLSPNAQGLSGIAGQLLPIYAGNSSIQNFSSELAQYDSSASSSLNSIVSSIPVVLLPYVNIQSKCSMGYSSWSGVPRVPPGANATDTSGVTNADDSAVQQEQQAQSDYTNAVATAKTDCANLCTADQNLSDAQARDNPIINNPKSSASQIQAAQQDLQNYTTAQQQAESANTKAQTDLQTAQANFQSTLPAGANLPASSACSCN
ncbi:MAG TPA: TadE/TadG family type IV pilus assembly protein [Pseudomonadales bacterium]|nr:TadE/TadG family type IV pilus assembly protein [Pseudomonadales bacterium]